MLSELAAGIRTAARYPVRLILMSLQFIVMSTVLTYALSDLVVQGQAFRAGQQLRDLNATVFGTYYASNEISTVSKAARRTIVRWTSAGDGYGVIKGNARIDNPEFANANPTVIIMGDKFSTLNKNLKLCDAPCAMRGSKAEVKVGQRLNFSGTPLTVNGKLPTSAAIFTADQVVELDDKVVVNLPPSSISSLSDIEIEELASSLVLFDISNTEIADYLDALRPSGLVPAPTQLAVSQPQSISRNLAMAALYLVAGGSFGLLMLLALMVTTDGILRRERWSLIVRSRFGATRAHLAARVAGIVLPGLVLPVLLVTLGMQFIGGPQATAGQTIAALVLAVACGLVFRAVRHNSQEIEGIV